MLFSPTLISLLSVRSLGDLPKSNTSEYYFLNPKKLELYMKDFALWTDTNEVRMCENLLGGENRLRFSGGSVLQTTFLSCSIVAFELYRLVSLRLLPPGDAQMVDSLQNGRGHRKPGSGVVHGILYSGSGTAWSNLPGALSTSKE